MDKIKIYVRDIKEIISINKSNINRILLNLEIYKKTNRIKVENIIDKQIDTILDLVYEKKIDNILKIRKLIYNLCSQHVDRYYILKYCFREVSKTLKTNNKKIELIAFLNETNTKLSNSFKNIIHIEYFFVKLFDLIE